MASLIAHSKGTSTTPAVDTTGATLIVCYTVYDLGGVVSDNKGNTWTALPFRTLGGAFAKFSYCLNPTVGAGHTFSVSGAPYEAIFMSAFNAPTLAYDTDVGATIGVATSLATGILTESVDNEIVVTAIGTDGSTTGQGVNFGNITDTLTAIGAVTYGGGMAYILEAAKQNRNFTWTWTNNSGNAIASAVSFKLAVQNTGSGMMSFFMG